MRWWRLLVAILGAMSLTISAQAQNTLSFSSLRVQLLPEYDQRSMLVIYDFDLPGDTQLPVGVTIRFPKDANLIAVASLSSNNSLIDADYLGPSASGDWQSITVQAQTKTTYHVEYYQPLSIQGQLRQFTYLWPGDYAVDDFTITIRIPIDTTNITTQPILTSSQDSTGTSFLTSDIGALTAGQEFPLQLNYTQTSDTLDVNQSRLQPSEPLGSNTLGRVMISNYIPYILGLVGLLLILGGAIYLWQSRHTADALVGRRRHATAQAEDASPDAVYCHQCGTRAERGDRFCRVCGSRLRTPS